MATGINLSSLYVLGKPRVLQEPQLAGHSQSSLDPLVLLQMDP